MIETVEGVQRIRGLAGSGKTVVLALKAAYLHAQHPEWKIAVTFNTRSLKGQLRQLINTFILNKPARNRTGTTCTSFMHGVHLAAENTQVCIYLLWNE